MNRRVRAVFHKEFVSYWNSPIGYIFLTLFLVATMAFFFLGGDFFITGQATMRPFFGLLPTMFMFFIPAVTMRLWAEERAKGTQEVLLTLPVLESEVVLGKYLAAVVFLALALALSATLPLTLYLIGEPDWGPIMGGYLGALLMGAAFLAIGLYTSVLTNNQIIAFLLAVLVSALFLLVSADFFTAWMPKQVADVSQYLGMSFHFINIGRGLIDSRDVIYYLSIIAFFVTITVRAVQSRRWA